MKYNMTSAKTYFNNIMNYVYKIDVQFSFMQNIFKIVLLISLQIRKYFPKKSIFVIIYKTIVMTSQIQTITHFSTFSNLKSI